MKNHPHPPPENTQTKTRHVADVLNDLLADEFVLYVKTLSFHWNVRGMQFHTLHPYFEQVYEEQFDAIDDLAERVRTAGGAATGTMKSFLEAATLKEQPEPPGDAREMIAQLLADYNEVLDALKEAIGEMGTRYDDPGTANFLTGLLEKQEKTAWTLRTHLDSDLR
jgi:starvation-inducible DNA-binding protein